MRHVVCSQVGAIDELRVEECPPRSAAAGQVIVDVEFAAVSFVDTLLVRGLYQIEQTMPYTPGSSVAGTISSVGSGVNHLSIGDRVVAVLDAGGGFADQSVAPAEMVIPLPDILPTDVAVSSVENYGTMSFTFERRAPVAPGEWVVVLGAGGAIGLAAVDIARAAGARVIGLASSEVKRSVSQQAGAEVTLSYEEITEIPGITGGGADIVIDPVGGDIAKTAIRLLGENGRYCVLGFASGQIPKLSANQVLLCNRSVVGIDWGDWARRRPAAAAQVITAVLQRIARGELHPPTPVRMPLEDAVAALDAIERREVAGKLVLATHQPAE
jgi:NADPH:quinone reductase